MTISRRKFIKLVAATIALGSGAYYLRQNNTNTTYDDLYDISVFGNTRILHITDTHGNLLPNYFKEPNVNLGIGYAYNKIPHIVGNNFLTEFGIKKKY